MDKVMKFVWYWVYRKYEQIRKVIKYIPIIWKSYDFDYSYSIKIFRLYLEDLATYLESDKPATLGAKDRASRIRTALRLFENVYDKELYAHEYMKIISDKYGKDALNMRLDSKYLYFEYETWENRDEIDSALSLELKKSVKKHQRAHKLLWDFIEHNIQYWWC